MRRISPRSFVNVTLPGVKRNSSASVNPPLLPVNCHARQWRSGSGASAASPLLFGDQTATTMGLFAFMLIIFIRRVFEPRTQISAKVPMGELIINRLLWDRDIRNREAWVHQRRQASENLEPREEEE